MSVVLNRAARPIRAISDMGRIYWNVNDLVDYLRTSAWRVGTQGFAKEALVYDQLADEFLQVSAQ